MIFEGALSTKAALLGKRRKVNKIYIDKEKKDRNTTFIIQQAENKNVTVEYLLRDQIDQLCKGKTHGGICCDVEERQYQSLQEVFKKEANPFICVLEGIEDPFNLGYALRSLYSAGCHGVILRKRDWSFVEDVIIKSSAGASEYIQWIESEDVQKEIQFCKKQGCKCYAAMRKEAISYFEADYTTPLVLAIGGEMRGLSRAVLDEVDQNVMIPYANDFKNSLNASSAVAALSFEVMRQRRK